MIRPLVLAALVAAAPVSPAAQAATPALHVFEGSCVAYETFAVTPPLGAVPRPTVLTTQSQGLCTGKVDGHEFTAAPMTGTAREALPEASCATSATGSGDAHLSVLVGKRWLNIDLLFDNVAYGSGARFLLRGAHSGLGYGEHTSPSDLTSTLEACGSGTLSGGLLTLALTSTSPLS